MDNSKRKNSVFVVATGVIIAVGRFLLGRVNTTLSNNNPTLSDDAILNNSQHILIVMALVNFVALGFVLLFLYNDFYKVYVAKISSNGLDTNQKKRCNCIVAFFSSLLLFIYLAVGILYMTVFKTSDLNDVISIIALAISIATNGLVDEYGDGYYKMVLKIEKTLFERKGTKRKKSVTSL